MPRGAAPLARIAWASAVVLPKPAPATTTVTGWSNRAANGSSTRGRTSSPCSGEGGTGARRPPGDGKPGITGTHPTLASSRLGSGGRCLLRGRHAFRRSVKTGSVSAGGMPSAWIWIRQRISPVPSVISSRRSRSTSTEWSNGRISSTVPSVTAKAKCWKGEKPTEGSTMIVPLVSPGGSIPITSTWDRYSMPRPASRRSNGLNRALNVTLIVTTSSVVVSTRRGRSTVGIPGNRRHPSLTARKPPRGH